MIASDEIESLDGSDDGLGDFEEADWSDEDGAEEAEDGDSLSGEEERGMDDLLARDPELEGCCIYCDVL